MGGVDEEKLGVVIDRFYEAATQPDLWRTVLHEASAALGAGGTTLLTYPDASQGMVWSEGVDELVDTFAKGAGDLPRVNRGFPHRQWELHSEATLFVPEELDRLPFYSELLGPLGYRWFAGTTLAKSSSNSIIVSFERRTKDGHFSQQELASISRALPHLRRAAELALRLGLSRAEGTLDGLDLLSCGGVLLDWLGRAIRLNAGAERHIGNGLTLAHGHLHASHRGANGAFQRLIASVLNGRQAHALSVLGPIAIPRHRGRSLMVHAAPLVASSQDIFGQAKAILMIVDPDEHREPAEPILRQAFRLTPAEARLAVALASGRDLREIAHSFHIETGTARTQLKAIFAKTGTHRQGELVALLGRFSLRPAPSDR